jgi:hypothetical protein
MRAFPGDTSNVSPEFQTSAPQGNSSFAIKFNFEERFFSYPIRQNSALDDSLRHDGMQRRNTRESKTSDLTYANRMFDGSITISVRSTKSASTQEFVDSQAGFVGGREFRVGSAEVGHVQLLGHEKCGRPEKNGRESQTSEMKKMQCNRRISRETNDRNASLGLASRGNRGPVPNPFDDQSLDQKGTNYNLAKVISGFGIN